MDGILTHSPFVFPEGTFLQRCPKLKTSIFKMLSKGMVRDSEDSYCVASKFLFRHSFNIKEPTWIEEIDGELEFMSTRLTHLSDHIQYSSFKEAVIDYVEAIVVNITDFEEYDNYDDFLIKNNLQFIPYEVLEYCYVLLNLYIPLERVITFKIEKRNMYLE